MQERGAEVLSWFPMQPQGPKPTEQIAGLVERVTFHSEESGFCVLRIKARGHRELVTVVGTLPEVRAGEWLEAQGAWVIDKEYGQQFRASWEDSHEARYANPGVMRS